MNKFLMLLFGLLSAPFVGSSDSATEKGLQQTAKITEALVGKATKVEIKTIDQMMLAAQDHTGPGKGRG
jgi:hypothetical protein